MNKSPPPGDPHDNAGFAALEQSRAPNTCAEPVLARLLFRAGDPLALTDNTGGRIAAGVFDDPPLGSAVMQP